MTEEKREALETALAAMKAMGLDDHSGTVANAIAKGEAALSTKQDAEVGVPSGRDAPSDEYRNAVLEEAACALWRLAQQYDAEVQPVGGSLQAQHYRFAANAIRALKQEGLVAGADGGSGAREAYRMGFDAGKSAAADKVRHLTTDFAIHGAIDSANLFKEIELCIQALVCPMSDARNAARDGSGSEQRERVATPIPREAARLEYLKPANAAARIMAVDYGMVDEDDARIVARAYLALLSTSSGE